MYLPETPEAADTVEVAVDAWCMTLPKVCDVDWMSFDVGTSMPPIKVVWIGRGSPLSHPGPVCMDGGGVGLPGLSGSTSSSSSTSTQSSSARLPEFSAFSLAMHLSLDSFASCRFFFFAACQVEDIKVYR